MGFFKKIFKPVSKVLDKIIPNEIKPFLPYAAAAFPMLYSGGLGGTSIMQQMLRRGAMSGALNIGGQLAQEGSEGDINLLSAGLASLAGGLTAPGTPGVEIGGPANMYGGQPGIPSAAEYFAGKGGETAMGQVYSGLGKASEYMSSPGLSKYSIPAAQGTADVMFAEAKRAEDDAEDAAAADDSSAGYTDAAYRAAIRKSMEAYGAEEEEILAAIEAAGYRSGGRVALRGGGDPNFGGITEAVENVNEEVIEEKKGGMLMEIAKVLFRLTPPGAGIMAAKDAYDMYQNLEDEDKEKVQEFGKKALKMASWGHPAGIALNAGKAAWDQAKENQMAEGGVPSVLPKGVEADYRGGGFIPIGSKERADDVPARLSENEFVMTADAVRAAGGGNVNKGAQRMYNVMNNLEARA